MKIRAEEKGLGERVFDGKSRNPFFLLSKLIFTIEYWLLRVLRLLKGVLMFKYQ